MTTKPTVMTNADPAFPKMEKTGSATEEIRRRTLRLSLEWRNDTVSATWVSCEKKAASMGARLA